MLTTLRFNLANTPIRREVLKKKEYIVAPMVMITEGVHNGSGGPLLYKADDLKRAVPAWNMKPIVVYHPQINGQGVSACDPTILESQQVGHVMNTHWDGTKLRAEAWIDVDSATTIDGRVIEALEGNKLMEVSTGLFTENVAEEGQWGDEAYTAVATNHQPDHLALLPDQIGACSIADGAGLLQLNEAAGDLPGVERLLARQMDVMRRMVGNMMSHGNTHAALSRALKERFKTGKDQHLWIADVYDDFVVYEIEGDGKATLYRLPYTAGEQGIELSTDTPVEVVRVTEYRTPKGEFVGNEAHPTKEPNMGKEQIVDGLIANEATQWTEDDRETLMGMDEAVLNKMDFKKKGKKKGVDEEDEEEAVQNAAAKGAAGVAPAPVALEQLPPEVRAVYNHGLAKLNEERDALIKTITENKANKFTPEYLATKEISELQGLAALAGGADTGGEQPQAPGAPAMFYGGAATPAQAPTANTKGGDKADVGLSLPTMNFDNTEAK